MSRDFNGTTQFAQLAAAPAATPLTLAAWVRADSAAGSGKALVCVCGAAFHYQLLGLSTALGKWYCGSRAGGSEYYAASTTAVSTGVWVHVAAVFASATSRAVFVNGVSEGSNATSTTPTLTRTAIASRNDGAVPGSFPSYFDGQMAHVAIWGAALTAAQIAGLAAGMSPLVVSSTAPWLYAPFRGESFPEVNFSGTAVTLSPTSSEAAKGTSDPRLYPA